MADPGNYPHRRYNQLSGEWVKVSPHRTKRPWQGHEETQAGESRPQYDPTCYLCPGNQRSGGEKNPQYTDNFSFVNDFAAILPENPAPPVTDGLLRAEPERGICKVICFTPRHDLSLPRMDLPAIESVVRLWKKEYIEIGSKEYINHVQIFENHGAVMGCSNPHPHCQIWAENMIPELSSREDRMQFSYFEKNGRTLLLDYLSQERRTGERIVCCNDDFVALVPYWAVWPYETIILPTSHLRSLSEFNERHVKNLASLMKELGIRYDNLFRTDFPYSMGLHQSPTDGKENSHWVFHIHYFPPLLRSATVKKFMVGYEMLGMPQRDITPETSAEILRALPTIHYLDAAGSRGGNA